MLILLLSKKEMSAITIILILELVASSLLVSLPVSHPKKDPRILGQNTYLAEDETPPADQPATTDQTNPANQTASPDQTPAPTENNSSPSQPTPTDHTAPTPEQPAPPETPPQPTENPPSPQPPTEPQNPAQTPPSPETTASAQPLVSPPESSSSTTLQTETPPTSSPEAQTPTEQTPEQSASNSANLPILNTDELTTDLSQINPQSQEDAAKEDSLLAAITDPTVKATALTTFASDKISDIDKFTRDQDFNSTAFASQRLSDQIDQLKGLSLQAPASGPIVQKLSDLCQQANVTLRTNQEIVPEELEQDLEITRGQCLGY